MNRLSAVNRCFNPSSIRAHSDDADHPRHDVHRPGAIRALPVVVHGERDAERQDVDLGEALPLLQLLDVERPKALDQSRGGRARVAMGVDQFVPQERERAQVGHWSNHAT